MAGRRNTDVAEGWTELCSAGQMGERLRFDEPLDQHCSLRVGGSAAIWADVECGAELSRIWELAGVDGLEMSVVGLGSNTLFADDGLDGVAIHMSGELAAADIKPLDDGTALMDIGAGAVNAHVVRALHRDGWVGAEFLALIPGTFGGAVAMNAGTKDADLAQILVEVDLIEPIDGGRGVRRRTVSADTLGLGYRHAELPDGALVLGGRIRVRRGDVDTARDAIRDDRQRRNRTQPYKLASVGSTFANPDGDYAGRVIEQVGLKGHAVGGARISEHHANFFINDAQATSADFLELMALARCRVRQRFGLELRPEVQFVGFDGFERMTAYEQELDE